MHLPGEARRPYREGTREDEEPSHLKDGTMPCLPRLQQERYEIREGGDGVFGWSRVGALGGEGKRAVRSGRAER